MLRKRKKLFHTASSFGVRIEVGGFWCVDAGDIVKFRHLVSDAHLKFED
jgi:hypothetical protein